MVVPIRYTGRCEELQSELLPDGFSRYLVHMEVADSTVSRVDITSIFFSSSADTSSREDVLLNIEYSAPFAALFGGNLDVINCVRGIFDAYDDRVLNQLVFVNRVFADRKFVDSASAREAILMAGYIGCSSNLCLCYWIIGRSEAPWIFGWCWRHPAKELRI